MGVYGRVRRAPDDNIIWRMRISFWNPKVRTLLEYLMRINFPRETWDARQYNFYPYVAFVMWLAYNTADNPHFARVLLSMNRIRPLRSGLAYIVEPLNKANCMVVFLFFFLGVSISRSHGRLSSLRLPCWRSLWRWSQGFLLSRITEEFVE